jgi:hypothetical protein
MAEPWQQYAQAESQQPSQDGPWAQYASRETGDVSTTPDKQQFEVGGQLTPQPGMLNRAVGAVVGGVGMGLMGAELGPWGVGIAGAGGAAIGAKEGITGLAKGIADFFYGVPKQAMTGQMTPEDEISAGFQAAIGMVAGGDTFRMPPEAIKAVAPVVKQFNDGVIAPAAQRLDSYARVGDPNGVRLDPPAPDTIPAPIRPIEGSPFAGVPRSVAAKTGIPEVDSVLNSPVTRAVIDHPVVDRSHDIPYMAGASDPINNPTVYIDKHVPKEQTVGGVTFDPADPWIVHENVEQHTMELLLRGGTDDFRETRGAGVQYHGTSQPNLEPSSDHYSTKNYYGQGFYSTDAVDAAYGYSRRGSRETGERNLFSVKPNRTLKIYDMEQPISDGLLKRITPPENSVGTIDEIVRVGLDANPKNLRELYDEMREQGTADGNSADVIQEAFDQVNSQLQEAGYDGMSHIGGLRTKTAAHRVEIYFNPEKDISVSKESFDSFKNRMTPEEAYRVAHFQFAEPAEQAWYRAHGIDQVAAEKEQATWLPKIQGENTTQAADAGQYERDRAPDRFGTTGKIVGLQISEIATKSRGAFAAQFSEGTAGKFIAKVASDNGNTGTLSSDRRTFIDNPSKPALFDTKEEAIAAAHEALGSTPKGSNVPPDLYEKPYPHDHVPNIDHEPVTETKPTPDEVARAKDIIRNAPELQPKSAAPMLQQARELGVIGLNAPENINLVELAKREQDTPAEAAFRAMPPKPLGAAVTPENMRGPMGHAPGSYDARGKEWIDKIDQPDDVRAAIEGMASQHDYYPESRGGKPSAAAVNAVAEAAGVDPKELATDHFAENFDNDGKVRAVIQAFRQTAKDWTEASERARKEPTEENAAAALEAELRANHVLEYTLGKRAESGRSLNAWKELLREQERAKAVVKVKADEAIGKIPEGVSDVVQAAGDVQSNLGKPTEGKIGLQKLVDAAEKLVTEHATSNVAREPLPPDLAGLVGEAKKALKGLTETGEKGEAELERFRQELSDLSEGNGSVVRSADAAKKLVEATKKPAKEGVEETEPKIPSERGKLISMAKRMVAAQEGTEKAARGSISPELAALSDAARVATGLLKQGRVRSEVTAFRDALEAFKTTGDGKELETRSRSLLDALGEKAKEAIEPKALVEIDKITALARRFVANSKQAAKDLLPPDLKSLVEDSKSALADLKKAQKTQLEKTVAAAEKQAVNMVKQKAVRKPIDALPPELQALVDKTERIVDRLGATPKGEKGALLLARAGRTAAEQAELARQVEGLTPNQIARVLARLRDNPRPGWFFWTVQQALISGLITHTKYVLVNTASTVFDRVISPELAAIGGKLRGQDVSLLAPLRAVLELFKAVPDAMSGFKQAFKTGTRPPLASELRLADRGEPSPAGARTAYGASGPNWGTFEPENFWGRAFNSTPEGLEKAARIIGIPGRSATGIHTFFSILNERAAAGSRAFASAEGEGVKLGSDEFWNRYQHHLDNPTDEVLKQNVEDALSGTFMEKLGEQSEKFARLIRNTPAKWLVFFTHIPLNMMRRGIEYSPLALLNTLGETKMGAAIKGELGADAQNLAFAKMGVGTAVGAYFIDQALQGNATGDYPTDPKERRRWQMEGIQANSIKANGQWLSLERLGPQAIVARLAANYASIIQHYDGQDDGALMKAGLAFVLGTAGVLADDVGFETIRNIVNVMENPEEAARFAAWQLSSYMMPVSLVTQFASAHDPYMRQADSLLAGLKYHIPYLRETLPPKRDPLFGEPAPNPGYGTILRSSPISTDPIKAELDRIGYYPTAPEKTIGHVKLSPEQYDRYEATAGPYVKALLTAHMATPQYRNAPVAAQVAMARGLVEGGRAQARAALQMDAAHLIKAGIDRRTQAITGQ